MRRACLDGKVRPARSLLLRSAMAEARAVGDAAGNWKLAKSGGGAPSGGRRMRARDDAVAALILAVAEGTRQHAANGGANDEAQIRLSVVFLITLPHYILSLDYQ